MILAAAYCRVSTDREEQANSFATQQLYFQQYLKHHSQWSLYKIYADEGISGTSTKNRVQFNTMIEDACSGCFQVILTKEVSRFSRNILDTIAYTRKLRAVGVRIIFLQDGIDTKEPDAELRLSIMGTIAQEESRKISSRVKWGQTRQMEKGVVFGRSMLGYEVKNGKLIPNPAEAELVKLIFNRYTMQRLSVSQIAGMLEEEGYLTHCGNCKWTGSQIRKVLKNEKYVGDLIQKKTYTPDYLTHEKKYNHGQEPFVIIKNHHEAIISRDLWEQTQDEMSRRCRNNGTASACSVQYACSGKILCGKCGSAYICKTKKRSDGSTYRRWYCSKAAAYGKAGCDIGFTLQEALVIEMVETALGTLEIPPPKDTNNIDNQYLLRCLMESVTVSVDGRAELRLRHLKQKWIFQIN